MAQTLTLKTLEAENCSFAGTSGVSAAHRHLCFIPGFLVQETGANYCTCRADGTPAPFHALDGLPDHLVLARNPCGNIISIKPSVIAGFIRFGNFYTREQAARCLD